MRFALAVCFCFPLIFTGCSIAPNSTAPVTAEPGLAIRGAVHGGQQPIVGAHVYLMAAGTGGDAGPGIAASSSNASVSLLTTGSLDSDNRYYVTTGAGGAFSIGGDYSCTPGAQVYIYAVGGDPGAGRTNSAAGLMAILGTCPSAKNFASATPFITVNEVSTVAAAYAFAGYATDAMHVSSSGTALANTGIQNAFANAANLADISSGAALATTPGGNGTVPQSEINTLANILASCINTDGSMSGPTNATACYTLLNSALSNGTSGTTPSDTASAAINIAHNPAANVPALYALPTAQSPFAPTLISEPNDFTVGLVFTGGGLDDPFAIAIDGSGNIWTANNATSTVTQLKSSGVAVSGSGGYTGGGLNGVSTLAIDLSGNVWVPNLYGGSVTELDSSGNFVSPSGGYSLGSGLNTPEPYAIAIDGSGDSWVTDLSNSAVLKLDNSGNVISPPGGYTGSLDFPRSIAIDSTGNAWVANKNNSTVTEILSSGTVISIGGGVNSPVNVPYAIAMDSFGNAWIANIGGNNNSTLTQLTSAGTPGFDSPYSGAGINNPHSVALDGADNVWMANDATASISEFSNAGMAVSPASGFVPPGVTACEAIAVDGSGDVWVTDPSATQITELIGAASPVVTPISAAVKNNKLAQRP